MTKRVTEVVTSTKRLEELFYLFYNADFISTDCETTGLSRFAEVIGISFSPSSEYGIYIPIQIWNGSSLISPWKDDARAIVQSWIEHQLLKSKRLITHNGSYDARVINNTFGINVIENIFADTQLLHHTLDSDPPHGLKPLAVKFISAEADSSQDDLKASVIANGGKWTKDEKHFYKGDWKLLGTYGAFDTIWTFALFEKFWAEINQPQNAKQLDLFLQEVMPLQAVTYEMETTGLRVDLEKTHQVDLEMTERIEALEDEVYASMAEPLKEFELKKIFETTKLTAQAQAGKALKAAGLEPNPEDPRVKEFLYQFVTNKAGTKRVFNLDAGDDKAFLIYDLMGIPCTEYTASGKRSTAKSTMDELAEKYEDHSPVIKMIKERSQQIKLQSTYIEAIKEGNIDGRIYPGFRQTGTTSGRYSAGGSSLNMQTLPREDKRIKSLFIPDDGWVFIGADYSSLEPHAFAVASGEPKLKKIFNEGLDFYSSIAIDVLGLTGVSANPNDPNYLGTVDKAKRQWVKAIALSIPYGAEGGRVSQLLGISYDEGKEVVEKYLKAFPVLKKWMDHCVLQMKLNGYVDGLTGRRKRGDLVKELYSKGFKDFSKRGMEAAFKRLGPREGIPDAISLYLECRNLFNVSRNHCIQSLAASVCNMAMVRFTREVKERKLQAKLILQIHDEIVVTCPKEESEEVATLLEDCMLNNPAIALLDVPMQADPVVSDKSLAEAK
jgi:DNA polymerase I-like protein with 3'-5' exonuclease and polymerase domains